MIDQRPKQQSEHAKYGGAAGLGSDAILTTRLRFSAQAHVGMAGLGRNDRWLIRQVLDDFTSGDLPLGRIHLTSDRSPNGELWHLASVVVRDGLRALINITPADDIMPERYQVLGILTAESDLVADTQTLLGAGPFEG
ncbi:hypothetical protein [Streptomyces sp. NBC_00140]|uniref:hypothetical protein n=1 Tax=Streptomyces sp. NBC_00140 TaxID=2975664 RepID=UPI0022504B14|nr:hypothetical protein [Streptomyces sp. NBC_00140]MCX5327848.1 hypothetical protein [Streptomyces sp. NBC_00140]